MTTEENKKTWKTLGILAIVFGGIGVLLSFTGSIGLYIAVLGLILGLGSIFMATKQQGKMTLAIIGIVLSVLGAYFSYNAMKAWSAVGDEFEKALNDGTLEKGLNDVLEEAKKDNH